MKLQNINRALGGRTKAIYILAGTGPDWKRNE